MASTTIQQLPEAGTLKNNDLFIVENVDGNATCKKSFDKLFEDSYTIDLTPETGLTITSPTDDTPITLQAQIKRLAPKLHRCVVTHNSVKFTNTTNSPVDLILYGVNIDGTDVNIVTGRWDANVSTFATSYWRKAIHFYATPTGEHRTQQFSIPANSSITFQYLYASNSIVHNN